MNWNHDDALRTIAGLDPTGFNREVAEYWLSLWRGDTPPTRAAFDPMKLARHLPAIAMFEVRAGNGVRCRAAGSHLRLGLGYELTGKDLIALTPENQRAQRMRNAEANVMGTVSVGHRTVKRGDGALEKIEEIVLPFADMAEDGSRRYIVHSNWRPKDDEMLEGAARTDMGLAGGRRSVTLR